MNKLNVLMVAFLVITLPTAFADDEFEEDEEREGFGLMEREREREHDEDLTLGSGTGNLILYFTLGAIGTSIGYTAFKILKPKRPMARKS